MLYLSARKSSGGQETYASHSVAAILMLVFQYAESSGKISGSSNIFAYILLLRVPSKIVAPYHEHET